MALKLIEIAAALIAGQAAHMNEQAAYILIPEADWVRVWFDLQLRLPDSGHVLCNEYGDLLFMGVPMRAWEGPFVIAWNAKWPPS
jgi:hypothetical protein